MKLKFLCIFFQIMASDRKCRSLCGVSLVFFNQTMLMLDKDFLDSNVMLPEDQLVLYFYKLKWAQPFTAIGVIFGICDKTASLIFGTILTRHTQIVRKYLEWPSKEAVQETMPPAFKLHAPNCRVIIDASETKIEMPSNTRANVLCWSSYKHHHTIKYLVAIAPDGTITFISKAYGGRISDGQLTTDCGILNLFEPGDEAYADKVRLSKILWHF